MWTDIESSIDYLNFGEISETAVEIIKSPNMLPVSIGLFGNWGAGKSTLLNLVSNKIIENGNNFIVVQFDAWLYQTYDDARAALLEIIAENLECRAKGNETLTKKIKHLFSKVDKLRTLGLVAETAAINMGIPTGGAIFKLLSSASNASESLKSGEFDTKQINEAKETMKLLGETGGKLINEQHTKSPPQEINEFRELYSEILKELKTPLVVFIDNLDRCLPAKAIQTLEAIRLFLFLPNTAYIIAADEDMIRGAVAEYFKNTNQRHQIDYLDKLIQIPIQVPKAGVLEIRAYLFMLFGIDKGLTNDELEKLRIQLETSLRESWKKPSFSRHEILKVIGKNGDAKFEAAFELADRISPVLATSPSIHGNPRIVKRLLNVIKMRTNIARRRGMPLDESIIAKLVIFERCAGKDATEDLFRLINQEDGHPKILATLEKLEKNDFPADTPESWKKIKPINFLMQWIKLEPMLSTVDLRAAIYLSRETLPITAPLQNISSEVIEAIEKLYAVTSFSSTSAKEIAKNIGVNDGIQIMEALISEMRKVQSWNEKPAGFIGACLLASEVSEAAILLKRFVDGLTKPPWMMPLIKEKWYTEN